MSRSLGELVAGVVAHNTGGPQSDTIDREHILVILTANGTDSPDAVERGIEMALEEGFISESGDGYALPEP